MFTNATRNTSNWLQQKTHGFSTATRPVPVRFSFGSRWVLVRSSFVSRSSLVAYSLVYRRPIENRTRIERISNERRTKEDRENDGKPSKTWRETVQFDGNGVSERGSLTRLAVCPCPFQCYGMGWGVGRVEASSQWCGQSVGKHGMCATPQYGGLSDTFLGCDTRQRGWFSVRREFPYLHRTGNLPFTEKTNYMKAPSPFGIKMADRISGKPLHIDI